MMKILFLLFAITLLSHADDIYLKSGFVVRNVTARDTIDNMLVVISKNGEKKIILTQIVKITRKAIDPDLGPTMEQYDERLVQNSFIDTSKTAENKVFITYERPKLGLITISVIAALLAYDNFDQSSRIDETINIYSDLNKNPQFTNKIDVSSLESEKAKRTGLGIAFLIISIANLSYSLEKVEVKSSPSGVTFSYNF